MYLLLLGSSNIILTVFQLFLPTFRLLDHWEAEFRDSKHNWPVEVARCQMHLSCSGFFSLLGLTRERYPNGRPIKALPIRDTHQAVTWTVHELILEFCISETKYSCSESQYLREKERNIIWKVKSVMFLIASDSKWLMEFLIVIFLIGRWI